MKERLERKLNEVEPEKKYTETREAYRDTSSDGQREKRNKKIDTQVTHIDSLIRSLITRLNTILSCVP